MFQNFLAGSWKVKVAAIASAVVAILSMVALPLLHGEAANYMGALASVAAAVGLGLARDNNKSSEDVGVK